MASIESLIANYNPNANRNADMQAVAAARLNEAQIPFVQRQTEEVQLKNQIAQRQIHDEEVYKQMIADAGRQAMQQPQPEAPAEGEEAAMAAATGAPSPVTAATPGQTGTVAAPIGTPAPRSPVNPVNIFTDPRAFQSEAARRGMSGAGVIAGTQRLIEQQTKLSTLTKDQLDNELKEHAFAGDSLRGYLETPDGPGKQQAYAAFYADLGKNAPDAQRWLPAPGSGVAPTADDLAHVTGVLHLTGTLLDAEKTKQETATSKATAAKAEADTKQAQAETEDKQFRLDLLKKAASGQAPDFNASVRAMSIFKGHPQEAQDAIDAATAAYKAAAASGDPLKAATDANEAVKGVADRLRAVSPGVVAGEAKKAAAVESATAPIRLEIQKAEAGYQNALQQGDKARADYYESLTSAKKAQATANTIQRVVDLAKQKNNAVAAQQLKAMVPELTNAAQDIKRMGGSQSQQMSTTLDGLIGQIKSASGNIPISDATIDAIAPFVDVIANGAAAQHNANVKALNQTYKGTKFDIEPLPHQSATGPDGHKIVSHDGGETWQDAQTGKEVK